MLKQEDSIKKIKLVPNTPFIWINKITQIYGLKAKDSQIGSQSKNYLYAAHKVHTWKKELHSKEMEVYAKTY